MSAFVPSFSPFARCPQPSATAHAQARHQPQTAMLLPTPPSARMLGTGAARMHHNPTSTFFSSGAFGAPMRRPQASVQQQQQQQQQQQMTPIYQTPRMDVTIVVGDNEPVESALRRFKKDVAKSGHLFELKRRRYFETNTEKRIRKAAQARRKAKMARVASRKQFK